MRLTSIGIVGFVLLSLGGIAEAQGGEEAPQPVADPEPQPVADPVPPPPGDPAGGTTEEVMMEPPQGYPVTFSQRPLTLPAMTLRGDLGFQILHLDLGLLGDDTVTSLGAGVGFGILDDLEVGLGASPIAATLPSYATALSVRGLSGVLSPDYARGFNQPQLYGRYRFVSTETVEVGAELGFIFPANDADFGMNLAVPARFRFGDNFALDAGLGFFTSFGEDAMGDRDPDFWLTLNLAPRFAMEMFYVGLDTGFVMPLGEDPDFTIIPLTFEAGATLGITETMVLDLFAHGGLPYFIVPGSDGDKAITEIWTLGFGARIYIGLAG